MDYVEEYGYSDEENLSDAERPDNPAADAEGKEKSGAKEGKRVAPPKPKRTQNPRPKLDSQRLIGERGIDQLFNTMEKIKFKGKGHETENLNLMMSSLEHWAHRLMPTMRFDDAISKVEKLGVKREVKSVLHRLRQGQQPSVAEEQIKSDSEEVDDAYYEPPPLNSETNSHHQQPMSDDEDEEKSDSARNDADSDDDRFPEIIAPRRRNLIYSDDEDELVINEDPQASSTQQEPINPTPTEPAAAVPAENDLDTPVSLSQDQRKMIAAKRLAALELRKKQLAASLFND